MPHRLNVFEAIVVYRSQILQLLHPLSPASISTISINFLVVLSTKSSDTFGSVDRPMFLCGRPQCFASESFVYASGSFGRLLLLNVCTVLMRYHMDGDPRDCHQ